MRCWMHATPNYVVAHGPQPSKGVCLAPQSRIACVRMHLQTAAGRCMRLACQQAVTVCSAAVVWQLTDIQCESPYSYRLARTLAQSQLSSLPEFTRTAAS